MSLPRPVKSAASILLGLLLAALAPAAHAQTARDLTDIGIELYQRANSPNALERMRQDLVKAPEAYLVDLEQPGALVLLTKRSIRVPSLKYNVALHLLEVRDSTGSHVWPPGSIDGFYLGRGADVRHFRSFAVRDAGTQTNFVEMLTAADNSPLVLGVQHIYIHKEAEIHPVLLTETRKAHTEITQVIVAGAAGEPLRVLALTERGVNRLFGARAPEMAAYAAKEHLTYTDLGQVLRMVEYYNKPVAKQ